MYVHRIIVIINVCSAPYFTQCNGHIDALTEQERALLASCKRDDVSVDEPVAVARVSHNIWLIILND